MCRFVLAATRRSGPANLRTDLKSHRDLVVQRLYWWSRVASTPPISGGLPTYFFISAPTGDRCV
jgi:hypothetical protein